jgi:hypothetical protein
VWTCEDLEFCSGWPDSRYNHALSSVVRFEAYYEFDEFLQCS